LLLLADEGGDELDHLVLLAARQVGDFREDLLDFARRPGFRLAAEEFGDRDIARGDGDLLHGEQVVVWEVVDRLPVRE